MTSSWFLALLPFLMDYHFDIFSPPSVAIHSRRHSLDPSWRSKNACSGRRNAVGRFPTGCTARHNVEHGGFTVPTCFATPNVPLEANVGARMPTGHVLYGGPRTSAYRQLTRSHAYHSAAARIVTGLNQLDASLTSRNSLLGFPDSAQALLLLQHGINTC